MKKIEEEKRIISYVIVTMILIMLFLLFILITLWFGGKIALSVVIGLALVFLFNALLMLY